MTRLFWLHGGDHAFGWLTLADTAEKGTAVNIARAVGTRQGEAWRPLPLEPIEDDEEPFLPTDFPYLPVAMPLLSRRAIEVLAPYFGDRVEWLATVGIGDYALMNCLVRLPALDLERTVGNRLESTGEFVSQRRVAFLPEVVRDQPIFCPEFMAPWVFVGESIVEAIAESRLTGVKLQEVWSEEGGPIDIPRQPFVGPPGWQEQVNAERRAKREALLAQQRER